MQTEIIKVLGDVLPLLDKADPQWVIFGSAALALNGVSGIRTCDIDIMMSREGAVNAERLLVAYLQEVDDGAGDLFRSRRSLYRIQGMEVDISGGLEILSNERWEPVTVRRVEVRQRVQYASLLDCMRLLGLFGRPKDLERLDYLLRI